ncbi:hypothetical protein AVL62_13130 [Serinicoccus chungangensis]|uniref:Uncharacterized protein n=1 Tax=Serinicoccus chungangensis TaxID=767452 RepID=A0A0W8IBQ6_9MICO|nr:hypothetical protein AVL62_13130 [Serinicoccus chungangensis]
MRELWADLEWLISCGPQDAITPESIECSTVKGRDHGKGITAGNGEFREAQHHCIPGIGHAPINLPAAPHEASPNMLHRIGIRQRHTRHTATHKKIDDNQSTQEFSSPDVPSQCRKFGECLNKFVNLAVRQRLDLEGSDAVGMEISESVVNELLHIVRRQCHNPNVASQSGLHQVPELLCFSFCDPIRAVDDQQPLGSAQFGKDVRQWSAQCPLKLDRCSRKMPQVDNKCLTFPFVCGGCCLNKESALSHARFAVHDDPIVGRGQRAKFGDRCAAIDMHLTGTISRGDLATHSGNCPLVQTIQQLPGVPVPTDRWCDEVVRIPSQEGQIDDRRLGRILPSEHAEAIADQCRTRNVLGPGDRDQFVCDARPVRLVRRLEPRQHNLKVRQ